MTLQPTSAHLIKQLKSFNKDSFKKHIKFLIWFSDLDWIFLKKAEFKEGVMIEGFLFIYISYFVCFEEFTSVLSGPGENKVA